MGTRKNWNTPGDSHELTFSTYRRIPVFIEPACARGFLKALQAWQERNQLALHAYVVMPDHVHVLFTPWAQEYDIGQLLHALKRPSSTRVLNALQKADAALTHKLLRTDSKGVTSPRLWQAGGGYDRNLYQSASREASQRYIHENPVRKGLCKLPEEYRWSSAWQYVHGKGDVDLTPLS